MSTKTDPTPAEIAALERRIAEEVMGWERYTNIPWLFRDERGVDIHVGCPDRDGDFGKCAWSPWNNPADALEVLERLATEGPYWIMRINSKVFEVGLGFPSDQRDEWAESPGPHYGPAVCELARKVMEGR